jgi:hypothetical protein
MDVVLGIVLLLLVAAPAGIAGAWFTNRGPEALAIFFRPAAAVELGWPRGVQEEDAPAWNWDGPRATDSDSMTDVVAEPVDWPARERLPAGSVTEITPDVVSGSPVVAVVPQMRRGTSRQRSYW